jgi:hypothetical protein
MPPEEPWHPPAPGERHVRGGGPPRFTHALTPPPSTSLHGIPPTLAPSPRGNLAPSPRGNLVPSPRGHLPPKPGRTARHRFRRHVRWDAERVRCGPIAAEHRGRRECGGGGGDPSGVLPQPGPRAASLSRSAAGTSKRRAGPTSQRVRRMVDTAACRASNQVGKSCRNRLRAHQAPWSVMEDGAGGETRADAEDV